MSETWVGKSLERVEDESLLRGLGRYADDLAVPAGTLHAAFIRSPVAHGIIRSIKTDNLPDDAVVVTGEDMLQLSRPFISGVKVDAPQYALAVDRVRYIGEPVALVLAANRYLAEDAADLIDVEYEQIPAVVDPEAAASGNAPKLHDGTDSNVLHEREFSYGDPGTAFATAAHVIETKIAYPRNSCTPIEGLNVLAHYLPGDDAYDVTANFQGPYTLHTVMARSLNVPGNRLRLKTPPDSGGSYGVKQAVFTYVVALGIASKIAGRPVKWVEDRLEHLSAATSSTNRVTTLKSAFGNHGKLLALDYDQLEDCGAYLKAPEPATLYRMHGNMTGAYAVEHLKIRNRVVVTNKTPTGLMRGFGGPQIYFPLERLMDLAAAQLGLDPIEIRRRNLVPSSAMPYRTASGALYDSGDYTGSLDRAAKEGGLQALVEKRKEARAAGRLYGIGCAAVVEPSISNMGYITTLLTPQQRERAGPKNGALATATVSFDPSGAITVNASSVPQGQGHRTVLAQVVADQLGVAPKSVVVTSDHDTTKDPWSISSGNYSSRFAGAVAGAAHLAAGRIRDRLARIAAADLNVTPDEVEFANGKVFAKSNPDNALPIVRPAAKAHWSPLSTPEDAGDGLRETEFWNMPELTEPDSEDRINSSGAHGFIFDFCGVEIDPETYEVRIDKYVTMHDAGTLLNPMLANGQIRGGFAHGLGAALLEKLDYGPDGSFITGTFADYLPPTACEIPHLTILHDCSPSPFTPLGAKGLGEGNCMSTPVCIANAVADALGKDIATLPLTRSNIATLMLEDEPAGRSQPQTPASPKATGDGHAMTGQGSTLVPATPEDLWAIMLDESKLAAVIPGCHSVKRTRDNAFSAEVTMGIGPVKGRFKVHMALSDLIEPKSLTLTGGATGPLGSSQGSGYVTLTPEADGTRVDYTYEARISGKVASVGGRMMDGAARTLINQFFARLSRQAGGQPPAQSPWTRLLEWLGLKS